VVALPARVRLGLGGEVVGGVHGQIAAVPASRVEASETSAANLALPRSSICAPRVIYRLPWTIGCPASLVIQQRGLRRRGQRHQRRQLNSASSLRRRSSTGP
jgi:hypothetical protein